MVTDTIGVGAGTRDPHTHANVVRLLVGNEVPGAAGGAAGEVGTEVVLESNVDDLDPRLWPGVLTALLDAGAADAWLTPILMKKGRPAHTLSVLVPVAALPAVRAVVFRETSSIGLREVAVAKHALQRETAHVQVDGEGVSVKVARLDGEVVNVQPEWDDVARAAAVLGRPVLDVLADAAAASRRLARP
jgi:uncharacterized protein (DUF111 family)